MFNERPPRNTLSPLSKALENLGPLLFTSQSRTMDTWFHDKKCVSALTESCGAHVFLQCQLSARRADVGIVCALLPVPQRAQQTPSRGLHTLNKASKSVCTKTCAQAFGPVNVTSLLLL